ncbi:MAG: hypothetical protein ACI9DH_000991 [Halioglobus sp.]|jgi:hypothetical protein
MKLAAITDTILDETSTPEQLRSVLHEFSKLCSQASGVVPNNSFDAWAEDSFLSSGVAINAQAAAHCVTDYQRTVVFLRGINAALVELLERFPEAPIKILYAGCGPYGTLLLPLLDRFDPDRLDIALIDYHQQSLDSVAQLIDFFDYRNYTINLHRGDACDYQHAEALHLIVAEVMQKALEQEPQFEATANLAPQLNPGGLFIPQRIEVELCLGSLAQERDILRRDGVVDGVLLSTSGARIPLGTVFIVLPREAVALAETATRNPNTGKLELVSAPVDIPYGANLDSFDMILFTRVQVFAHYHLSDYEAEITLPLLCSELTDIRAGQRCKVTYELGSYPKFNVEKI